MGRAGAADGGPRHPRQTRSVHVHAEAAPLEALQQARSRRPYYFEPQIIVFKVSLSLTEIPPVPWLGPVGDAPDGVGVRDMPVSVQGAATRSPGREREVTY